MKFGTHVRSYRFSVSTDIFFSNIIANRFFIFFFSKILIVFKISLLEKNIKICLQVYYYEKK
jgi:hypothetical protein